MRIELEATFKYFCYKIIFLGTLIAYTEYFARQITDYNKVKKIFLLIINILHKYVLNSVTGLFH
jgi:hypothetical protein